MSLRLLLLLLLMPLAQLPAATTPPNVILVLTDDQGLGDLSLYGNPVLQTPHMDALARSGVRFDQFHVTSMCSPTRAALLTGRNPLENGVISTCQGYGHLREGFPTLAQAFDEAGYATGIFGKWHLGRNWPNRPEDVGFQETVTLHGFGTTGISSRWNNDYVDTWVVRNGEETQLEGFCTDAFFTAAMDWMGEQAAEGKAFFAYIPTNAPHFPFWAPHDLTEKYAHTKNPEFFAMMENLDDNMGRLEAFLEKNGLTENTIVLFLSDNGPVGGKSTYNAGMTGGKATPWEGGHRVPLFIRYPAGGVEGGRVIEELTDVTDLFPTILAMTGIAAPKGTELTGLDLSPAMRGEGEIPMDRLLFMQIQQGELDPKQAAVMLGHWRLLWADALYDIEKDLAQEHNLADTHPEMFTQLWRQFQRRYYRLRKQALNAPAEKIGSPHQEEVILDASAWIGVRADGQGSVRAGASKNFGPTGGAWKIDALKEGKYEILLRRWPVESGLALDAGAPPFETVCSGEPERAGVAFPIDHATLDLDTVRFTAKPADDPTAVRFELEIPQGEHQLHGIFRDADGKAVCGAFYAHVRRM